MEATTSMTTPSKEASRWVFTLTDFLGAHTTAVFSDTYLLLSLFLFSFLLTWAFSHGGVAWKNGRSHLGRVPIPGLRGLPVLGCLLSLTSGLPHRTLSDMARALGAKQLMAFSIGQTPAVVCSDPGLAREILSHPSLADRPLKQSARELMFARAMGFAPSGAYWRLLRGIAASHLFAPRRIAAHEPSRQRDCEDMLRAMAAEQTKRGFVSLRQHLQGAALNNIMGSVFGKRYDVLLEVDDDEVSKLRSMVREGFELLGLFNWSDHLPWLGRLYDPEDVTRRCASLVPRVREFVKGIIDEHRKRLVDQHVADNADFVDVLLSLEGHSKLHEDDMIAVLWEMIFRGTDTTALLTEWAMAELVLNPAIQAKLRAEVDAIQGPITDSVVAMLPYLQAVVKETLRVHPPGPLLSWARLSTSDVHLSNGMVVPSHTTAMINMWSITHDPTVWAEPERFSPERFVVADGGEDVDIRGGDMRLAPFGAGRRVCPGKNLGLATVGLWVGRLVKQFEWTQFGGAPVELDEVLKLSCEMKSPLVAVAVPRIKSVSI